MEPSYHDGDVILIMRWKNPRVGDVIVVPDPRARERLLLKRIVKETDTDFHVAGDNPLESADSRVFGSIPKNTILGTVFYP